MTSGGLQMNRQPSLEGNMQGKPRPRREYAIKHDNGGTFYIDTNGIGPRFGGTEETAMRFPTKKLAMRKTGEHWGFVGVKIVLLKPLSVQKEKTHA